MLPTLSFGLGDRRRQRRRHTRPQRRSSPSGATRHGLRPPHHRVARRAGGQPDFQWPPRRRAASAPSSSSMRSSSATLAIIVKRLMIAEPLPKASAPAPEEICRVEPQSPWRSQRDRPTADRTRRGSVGRRGPRRVSDRHVLRAGRRSAERRGRRGSCSPRRDATPDQASPLIAATSAQAEQAVEFNDAARMLATHFWPGPLSLVLPARPVVQPCGARRRGHGGGESAGSSDRAGRSPRAAGFCITATSANRLRRAARAIAGDIDAVLLARIDLLIDGGQTPGLAAVDDRRSSPTACPGSCAPGAIAWEPRARIAAVMRGSASRSAGERRPRACGARRALQRILTPVRSRTFSR